MASFMAVGRENPEREEVTSFANLLRTFLPDSDLSLTESTDQLLQQVKGSLLEHNSVDGNHTSGGTSHGPDRPQLEQPVKSEAASASPAHLNVNSTAGPLKNDSDDDSDATIDLPPSLTKQCDLVLPIKEITDEKSHEDTNSPKQFACFVCDDIFTDLLNYTTHMIVHCSENAYIHCSDCGETFNSQIIYNNHRSLSTYEIWVDRALAEEVLNTTASTVKDESPGRKKKRKKGVRGERYVCRACGKFIYKYSSFLKHVRTHEGISAFRCAVCQETFEAPCFLRAHIDLQHSHVLPFQCRRCLRRFKLRCSLSTHLKYCQMDHSKLPFAEEIQYIDQLSQQRKFQGAEDDDGLSQYSCPICTVMFDTPEELKLHLKYHDETKPHKCKLCGRGFQSRRMLQKHIDLHDTKHDCQCEICGVQLLTMSGYNAHLRGHRNQEIIQAQFFPDSSADASGDNSVVEPALEILQRLKSQNKPKLDPPAGNSEQKPLVQEGSKKRKKGYACPICGLEFHSGGVKFQIHARKEHKDAVFEKCSLCTKTFFGRENLERHIQLHKMFAETYTCDECGKTFRRKYALQVHKKMHTFKKFVKCDICGQEFRFVSEVDKHKNKKHRYDRMLNIYKCNICGQRFPMLSHLSVHCYCHNLPDSKPFECDLCKVSFKTSIELKQHIYQVHDELMTKLGESAYLPDSGTFVSLAQTSTDGPVIKQEPMDEEETERTGDANSKTNEQSGGSCSDLSQLKMDSGSTLDAGPANLGNEDSGEKQSHLPSNVTEYNMISRQFSHHSKVLKRYICEVCQKAFSSNSDLKTHRRTHSGETPFKCDYCDRSFKQRGHRKLHIQVVHTKVMPYKCDQCDSAFPTRSRYQIHLKRHMGLREHHCPYCEREFYTLGKLNEHKKKRHAEEMMQEQLKKQ